AEEEEESASSAVSSPATTTTTTTNNSNNSNNTNINSNNNNTSNNNSESNNTNNNNNNTNNNIDDESGSGNADGLSSIDDLLLQLDDLDARSKVLQRQAQRDHARAKKEDEEVGAKMIKSKLALPTHEEDADELGASPSSAPTEAAAGTAAEAIARQHPLQGLGLSAAGVGEFRRQAQGRQRRERPPMLPPTPSDHAPGLRRNPLPLGSSASTREVSAAAAAAGPPTSARGVRSSRGGVALPPLKP
ncbi:unnamed protein product, partial [Polarella glacialis]